MAPQGPPPIFTAHLFPLLEARLLDLLRSLAPAEWDTPTIAGRWTVRDVTAHLLDTQLRRLSMGRDRYVPSGLARPATEADLVARIDRLNADGVALYGRLSPNVLIMLMDAASGQLCDYLQSLDPFASGLGVSWAGETRSANWFDTAREFTERWHHQQQIRHAVDRPGIMIRELYFPVLDCFMRALPHHYRTKPAPAGSLLQFHISGPSGGEWNLFRDDTEWRLIETAAGTPVAGISLPEEIAWQLFTNGIDESFVRSQTRVSGDAGLATHVLTMLSIVGRPRE